MCRYTAERLKSTGKQSIFNLGDDTDLTHGGSNIRDIDKFDNPQRNEHTFPLQSFLLGYKQCCEFLTFSYGFADPYHLLTDQDQDQDPALFLGGFQNVKRIFFSTFFAYNFLKVHMYISL